MTDTNQLTHIQARAKAELIKRAKHEALLRECRSDSNTFIEYCFRDQETGELCVQEWFHREWQDAMSEHDSAFIVAPRGHGKCLAAGTLITLADGSRIPIEDFEGGEIWSINPETWRVESSYSPAAISNGTKDVFEIQLRTGRIIQATANHRFLRLNGWIEVQNMKPGQRIAIQRRLPNVEYKETLASGDGFLLGFLCGDGCVTSRVGFSCGDRDLVKFIAAICYRQDWKVGLVPGCINNCDYRITYIAGAHSGGPTHWARDYGLLGHNWNTKRVPLAIFTASDKDIFEFCLGYFLADGTTNTCRDSQLEYYSINLSLLLDTQELLSRLGIHGTIAVKRGKDRDGQPHSSYRFTVRGESFRSFCDLVDTTRYGDLDKIRRLLDAYDGDIINGMSTRLDAVESEYLDLPAWRKRAYKNVTFHTLTRIRHRCPMSEKLLDTDLLWDEIMSVTYAGTVETYDLTVPGNQCFLANGIVSHNTSQLVGRVVWELGNNHELRVKIVCQEADKAKERLYEVRQAIEKNERVQEVFPELKPDLEAKWAQGALIVKRRSGIRDASVGCLSIVGSASGGRADLLIFDDVCDRRNSLDQPSLRRQVIRAYNSDFLPLLAPGGRIVYICTLWHKKDLNSLLLKSGKFYVLNHSINPNTLEPIWPAKWPKHRLLKRRSQMRPDDFLRAYCNMLQSEDASIVQKKWIKYYTELPPLSELLIFQAIDPASALHEGADFFGHGTFAIHEKSRTLYVINIFQTQIPFPKQIQLTRRMFEAVNAQAILAENVAYQRVLAQFLTFEGVDDEETMQMVTMGEDNVSPLPVIEVYPIKNKSQRLRVASTYMYRGRVLWNPNLDPEAGRPVINPELGDPITQVTNFPETDHDDMVDVFTYAVIWAFLFGMGADIDEEFEGDLNIKVIGVSDHERSRE